MKSNLNILATIAIAAATSFAAPAFAESGGHGGGGPIGNGYHGFCTGECAPKQTDHVAAADTKLYAKK